MKRKLPQTFFKNIGYWGRTFGRRAGMVWRQCLNVAPNAVI
jgi:hypothetical protein